MAGAPPCQAKEIPWVRKRPRAGAEEAAHKMHWFAAPRRPRSLCITNPRGRSPARRKVLRGNTGLHGGPSALSRPSGELPVEGDLGFQQLGDGAAGLRALGQLLELLARNVGNGSLELQRRLRDLEAGAFRLERNGGRGRNALRRESGALQGERERHGEAA